MTESGTLEAAAPRLNGEAAHEARSMQLALVLWNGDVGGAETFTAAMAGQMRRLGVDARIVFVSHGGLLARRLEAIGVPYAVLDHRRGSDVVRRPRAFARSLARYGADGAIVPEPGFLGATLRLGGYARPLVAIEHGTVLLLRRMPAWQRLRYNADRLTGVLANNVEVAVSDFALSEVLRHPHARRVVRIYCGVDVARYRPTPRSRTASRDGGCSIGYAGRLAAGKGVGTLICAFASARRLHPELGLRIAGDGPERGTLEALVDSLGIRAATSFIGWTDDLPGFWSSCDIAAVPSTEAESLCMAAVEAMACGQPVIASRTGALEEVVDENRTGQLVQPGDVKGLSAALDVYARDPKLRLIHGVAGRAKCETTFNLESSTCRYLELFRQHGRRSSLAFMGS